MDNSSQQSQVQPSVEKPAQQANSPRSFGSSKIFVGIFIIVALIVSFVAGGFILGVNKSKPPVQNVIVPTPSPTEASAKAGDPTATWKTYENPSFSFRYPNEASAKESKAFSYVTFQNSDNSVVVSPPYQEPWDKWYSYVVTYENNPQNLSAKEIIDTYLRHVQQTCSPPGCSEIKLIQDTRREYRNNEVDGYIFHVGAETDSIRVLQVKGSAVYIFFMTGDQGNINDHGIKLLGQILSTFRFSP